MATLEVRLFGALAVQRDGQPLPRFPSRRVKDLLCYLVLTRETVHARDHLAGLFWGDHEEHKARHCLNTALWRLNRVLGTPRTGEHPFLHVDSQSLGFNRASDASIDVAEFEARCALADRVAAHAPAQAAALYQEAIGFYTGDLLIDCYDDWCLVERERLQRLYTRALTRLLAWHTAQGNYDTAVECGQTILARDGLREEVHRDLIAVHLAAGQPAAALRQYRACEAILREELGIAPMPETQALLPKIVARMPAATSELPVTTTVLSPPAPHAGLAAALVQLREAIATYDRARVQLQQAYETVERLGGA